MMGIGQACHIKKVDATIVADGKRMCIQVLHTIHNASKSDNKVARLRANKQQHSALHIPEHTLGPHCLIDQPIHYSQIRVPLV